MRPTFVVRESGSSLSEEIAHATHPACRRAAFGDDGRGIAQDGAGPPWDISGDWTCVAQCQPGLTGKPTHVIQHGAQISLINEAGIASNAEWRSDNWISFIGCDDNAFLSDDHRRLEFSFGPLWAR